jgi:energy-converting hydrogenase Eha subunit C
MNHVERAKRMVVAVSLCLCLGSLAAVQSRSPVNKIWVGLTYAAAKQGVSPGKIAVMGVAGVWDAAVVGAAFGTIGGPAGIAAGAAVGL